MNCNESKILIDKFIEGDLDKEQLNVLKQHTLDCQQCRQEFQIVCNMSSVLTQSLCTEAATDEVISKIKSGTCQQRNTPVFSKNKWLAAAACILVGFGLAKMTGSNDNNMRQADKKVPMAATEVNGMVLVKHSNSEQWKPLAAESKIHLGDTFHCASKSGFVLVLEDGSTMALDENSTLQLKEYNGYTDFYLAHGKVDSDLRSPHRPFFISTPHGRVEALGTVFTVSVD